MDATCLLGMMPSSGNKIKGNNAVTAIEVPSPTHQIAINKTMANIRRALSFIPSGNGMSKITQNTVRPESKTTTFFLNVISIREY